MKIFNDTIHEFTLFLQNLIVKEQTSLILTQECVSALVVKAKGVVLCVMRFVAEAPNDIGNVVSEIFNELMYMARCLAGIPHAELFEELHIEVGIRRMMM